MSGNKVLKPRPYQKDAIEAALEALRDSDRTTIVMACGTGKTLVSQRIAEALIKDGSVVVALFPSIGLLDQTYRLWKQNSTNQFQAIAICSDETVGKEADGFKVEDLSIESTTSPEVLKDWVQEFSGSHRIIFATYQSSEVIQIAQDSMGMQEVDLIVFDEAHRTTGLTSKQFSTALDQKKVRSSKRLFLTATPKVHSGKSDDTVYSMDDESVYGKVSYELTFAEAVRLGRLSDYQVAIVAITEKEVHQAILDNPKMNVAGKELDVEMVASQIALGRAIQEYNLNRTIVFHNRIGKSKDFARSLPTTLGLVDESFTDRTNVVHMDAKTDTSKRVQELEKFVELEQGQIGVLSNVKVLGEGIDSPVIDSIMFSDPKTSYIEVAQAVGRAMRLHPTRKEPSIILLPVFVNPLESGEAALDDSRFKHVWSTIRALADNDSKFASDLAFNRAFSTEGGETHTLPEKIRFTGKSNEISESFSRSFAMKLIDRTTDKWHLGLNELEVYRDQFKHTNAPQGYKTSSGFDLGLWVAKQREAGINRTLSKRRRDTLNEMGFVWIVRLDSWSKTKEEFVIFGDPIVPSNYKTVSGFALGAWVSNQRTALKTGKLPSWKKSELDSLGFIWDMIDHNWNERFDRWVNCKEVLDPESSSWATKQRFDMKAGKLSFERVSRLNQAGFKWDTKSLKLDEAKMEFVKNNGTEVSVKYVTPSGFHLGSWISNLRTQYKNGTLSSEKKEELDRIGFIWEVRKDEWSIKKDEFVNHGDPYVKKSYITTSGFPLGQWVVNQRALLNRGELSKEKEVALTEAGFVWNVREIEIQDRWNKMIMEYKKHDNPNVPVSFVTDSGERLGGWCSKQRTLRKSGKLSLERIAELDALGFVWKAHK